MRQKSRVEDQYMSLLWRHFVRIRFFFEFIVCFDRSDKSTASIGESSKNAPSNENGGTNELEKTAIIDVPDGAFDVGEVTKELEGIVEGKRNHKQGVGGGWCVKWEGDYWSYKLKFLTLVFKTFIEPYIEELFVLVVYANLVLKECLVRYFIFTSENDCAEFGA